jgi:hypothetical protein
MIAIDESRVQIRRRMRGPTRESTLDTVDDFCWLHHKTQETETHTSVLSSPPAWRRSSTPNHDREQAPCRRRRPRPPARARVQAGAQAPEICGASYLSSVGAFVLMFAAPIVATERASAKFVLTHFNTDNSAGIHSNLYIFVLGLLMSQYTFTGYDASAHMVPLTTLLGSMLW